MIERYALGSKKMLAMGILEILKDYTDYDHRLTQQQIIELLDKNYGMVCDRKSVKNNIINLMDWGYDIENDKGWYLATREFEDGELRILIDSVLHSKSIPAEQAKILIEKIKGLGSSHFDDKMSKSTAIGRLNRTKNKDAMVNIEMIEDTIKDGKQIEFVYNTYGTDKKMHPRRDKKYIVNPYQVIISGKPYLLCNTDKHDNLSTYRIDRMTELKVLNEKVKSITEIKGKNYVFDLPKHMSEHIYMFNDDVSRIKFKAKKYMMGEIVDWFGMEFTVRQETEEDVVIQVNSSEQAMVFWAMQYGEFVEVLEPESVRERVKGIVKKMMERYE